MNKTEITPLSQEFKITTTYHSYRKCQNYDAEIRAALNADGTITLYPTGVTNDTGFTFMNSDPDRVIAIAEMIKAFAQMAKDRSE